MISYNRSAFGVNLLFRVHGSAIYRSVIPALLSVGCFIGLRQMHYFNIIGTYQGQINQIQHPYAVGVIVTGTTFLIVFRASQGYSRYWEATSAIFNMMSKWMDSSSHIAAYHMQSAHYDKIKPPSFHSIHELNSQFYTRDRERYRDESTMLHTNTDNPLHEERGEEMIDFTNEAADFYSEDFGSSSNHDSPLQDSQRSNTSRSDDIQRVSRSTRAIQRSINVVDLESNQKKRPFLQSLRQYPTPTKQRFVTPISTNDVLHNDGSHPIPLWGPGRLDGNWGALFEDGKATFHNPKSTLPRSNNSVTSAAKYYQEQDNDRRGFASTRGGRTAPLFLQELAHLTSLMNAVALSTLRNDVDGAESPLDLYEPGGPWPNMDPADDHKRSSSSYANAYPTEHIIPVILYFFGVGRSPEERTLYNAARPLPVLGGVSDSEIKFLQMARGPYAKTQLCWYWLSEFIIREHLAGSTGNVGPPIISRTIQFISDGMTFYNQARKIMFIPFPFVHAQLSAAFVLVMIPAIPLLMDQYTTEDTEWFGIILTFIGVICLSGIHEVARELENPFRNVPNELPVVRLQAEFNETLLTMYAGYHPDLFWEEPVAATGPGCSINNSQRCQDPGFETIHEAPNLSDESQSSSSSPEIAKNEQQQQHQSSPEEQNMQKEPLREEQQNVETLRQVLEQQGKLIERMMEEQLRLNQMVGSLLLPKQ